MSPYDQQLAIGKACGYDFGPYGGAYLADYLHDLNAMHEAEQVLLKNDALLWHKYASHLDENYVNQPYTVGATAAQRAGALLRTIGKWEDGK